MAGKSHPAPARPPLTLHRTCNVSRTAQTLTPPPMSSTSNLSGRPSRCSVRCPFSYVLPILTRRPSRRNALLVTPPVFSFTSHHVLSPGFLPVIYTWLRSRSQSLQLQPDADDVVPNKLAPQSLSGWKPLLLWVPAACDLTGTTVRSQTYSVFQIRANPLLANECWPSLYACFHISNDTRRPRLVRRRIQRHISPTSSLALSVRQSFHLIFLK
jgi:hypothetical protein